MKKFILLLFLVCDAAYAQSFTMTCDTLVKSGLPGSFFVFNPQLTNLSGNTIQIRISRRQNQLPTPNWSSSICYGSCYPPDTDTINEEMPFPFSGIDFTIDVQSDAVVPGTATVTVAVVNKMNETDFQQLTFTASTVTTDISEDNNKPNQIELLPNYPNPFNPATTISYRIPESGGTHPARLVIYNTLGQKVKTLVSATQPPGLYSIHWDGKDDKGLRVSSGVYLYQLSSGTFNSSRKMILTK